MWTQIHVTFLQKQRAKPGSFQICNLRADKTPRQGELNGHRKMSPNDSETFPGLLMHLLFCSAPFFFFLNFTEHVFRWPSLSQFPLPTAPSALPLSEPG